jgi:hypothetical protein
VRDRGQAAEPALAAAVVRLTVALPRVVSAARMLGVRIHRQVHLSGAAGVRLTPGIVRGTERRAGCECDREDECLQPREARSRPTQNLFTPWQGGDSAAGGRSRRLVEL